MLKHRVSQQVIKRLPRYYRYLTELSENNVERISSKDLGEMMGLTASQIRQDFNCFGGFGQQGFGYPVVELKREIAHILGLGKIYNLILIGAGNIGQALVKYPGFQREGFCIKAIFDIDPGLVGKEINGINVSHSDELEKYAENNLVDMAILAVNQTAALPVAEKLKSLGITRIWNFAPRDIKIDGMVVENANLSDTLFMLSFRINEHKTLKIKKKD